MRLILIILLTLAVSVQSGTSQKIDNQTIKERIEQYKSDVRGPYRDIRWFCKDGSVLMPKESCPKPGGVQRARYKEEVLALAASNHIFLGQILSTTPNDEFWDDDNYNSRLKQYQLEKYLRSVDDGWVLQKGQFYRGAFQIEDEEAWGIDFFQWLLKMDAPVQSKFFLVRQAIKDIPHQGEDNKTLSVRALSKTIADTYSPFMDLRVKIHGQPEALDIEKVRAFRETHKSKLKSETLKKMDALIADMEIVFQPVNPGKLTKILSAVPSNSPIRKLLETYIEDLKVEKSGPFVAMATAEMLAEIRSAMLSVQGSKARLALFDLSNALEEIYFKEVNSWEASTLEEAADKICYTGLAAMGTGFIEKWEWEETVGTLAGTGLESMTLGDLHTYLDRARGLIEWGTGMVNGVYKDVVNLYSGFESLAYGFYDDRIRASVLLPLGNAVGELGGFIAKESNLTNKVMGASNQSTFRGLNPGFAFGELVIAGEKELEGEVSKDKIYLFLNPPSDLKPVAGIMTVTEGNMVSHVQLLARNLGIPNAVLSNENLQEMGKHAGKKVFYAVSNRGTVIMKPENDMTEEEKNLFAVKTRSDERITVPIEKMDLSQNSVLNMRQVNAASSGKICGPKAANLGELKSMFPDNVVEGLVIPFGIFRDHMDQTMGDQSVSYWEFLNTTFNEAATMRENNKSEEEIEIFVLKELTVLREAIKTMTLKPAFVSDLESSFEAAFEKAIGEVPVFLRSDTNMEDLKDFTGAGLNLTLFNVVDRQKILQGIKDVWASPYTERSFKWRQRYLLNPENVFPSILIIPSVDVEYSGVLITKGITTGDGKDITIAFSRGAGGAVDGQAAESYLLHHSGQNRLLSPAREPTFRRLPATGGSKINFATFEKPILNPMNLNDLRWMAYEMDQKMADPSTGQSAGPWDIELGFKDNGIWLFQIRPFVENKNAKTSAYLESISPTVEYSKVIKMDTSLN